MESDWSAYKSKKSLISLIKQIDADWPNEFTEKIRRVNRHINQFAKVYYTKGNFMLLPNRQMNNERYILYEDRIDSTLYECFKGGTLYKYFGSDNKVIDWINEENLSLMFYDEMIAKDKVRWFVGNGHKNISEMSSDEVYQYLTNSTKFIKERNN